MDDVFMVLRNREVRVEILKVCPAERDVGIFYPWADDFRVYDLETGEPITLTDDEDAAVVQKCGDAIIERQSKSEFE